MTQTTYAGIDYSLGQSNVDRETGIHCGVISQHSVPYEYQEDFEMDYGPATCGQCGNKAIESSDVPDELQEQLWYKGQDYACIQCERTFWSDQAFSDEPLGWSYDRDGYQLTNCLDSDIFILRSPFYTHAQYCSPCVPGAGNLDSPCEDGPKTYCLGHDWFEGGEAPYPVFSVRDSAPVLASHTND
jgi:hypothetical protein